MGKFIITNQRNGEFQFKLKARNGQIILIGESYITKNACISGLEAVKVNATIEDRYEHKKASNGTFMFNLKTANGQKIGSSETYKSIASKNNGIASVMKNAPHADIEDQTV